MGVITELCKLSPQTVGPAVGKSIRRLYGYLADGLDVEIARRFAEWFAIHMSNFGFQWVWKEWLPDLVLVPEHPKRAFMRRALEYEIRLAYYERIAKTLPEEMQETVLPPEAPGPTFVYEDAAHPNYENAQAVLNLFRGRAKAEEVIAHLDTLNPAASLDIAIQSLLHIGARSFSHLLNAIERYLPLLRHLATPENKAEILSIIASFWKSNGQMVGIVFDKMMQYQIVDPSDVIGWTFANGEEGIAPLDWDLLRGAVDKANGRVTIARKKVGVLRKEDDDARAKARAAEGTAMEVDGTNPGAGDSSLTENPALSTAVKAFSSLVREQKGGLSRALEGFVKCLAPNKIVITEAQWEDRMNWGKHEWAAWETWSWYRHFCRVVSLVSC